MTRVPLVSGLCLALVGALVGSEVVLAQPAPDRVRSIQRLGTPARMTPPVRDVAALQRTFARPQTQNDVSAVLGLAGLSHIEAEVKTAIAGGAVREVTMAPGTEMLWMALRRGGTRPDILRQVRWDGPKPFAGFEFLVEDGKERFTFVIPQDCGNLSLVSREPVRQAAAAPPPPPPPAPAPAPAPPPPPPPPPPQAVAARTEQPPPPPPPVAVERSAWGPFVAAFGGKQRRQYDGDDPAGLGTAFLPGFCDPLVGAKVGVERSLGDHWVVAPAIGFAYNTDESDRSSLFIDAELNYRFANRAYVGAGVGVWDLTHGDFLTPTALVHVGVPLWTSADRKALFFVTEGRVFFDRVGDIDSNYQFWGGLRFLFR